MVRTSIVDRTIGKGVYLGWGGLRGGNLDKESVQFPGVIPGGPVAAGTLLYLGQPGAGDA